MIRFALPVLAVLCLTGLHAQHNRLELPTAYIRNESLGNNQLPQNVEGSPYYDENFRSGQIRIGDTAYAALLRYNAFTDEIEMQEGGQVRELFKRDYISARIGDTEYAIRTYDDKGGQRQGYFRILTQGKAELLLRMTKDLQEGREATTSYGKDQPPRFTETSDYYLVSEGKAARKVRLRKKELQESFPEKWGELEAYGKQNGLDLKTERDVIRLVQHYNAL